MNPLPFDLVMFDLDGTLIETAPEICDATNDTLAQFGRPLVTQAQVNDWIGHGTQTLLVQALAAAGGTTTDAVAIRAQMDKAVKALTNANNPSSLEGIDDKGGTINDTRVGVVENGKIKEVKLSTLNAAK